MQWEFSHNKAPLPGLTVVGVLAFLCCLMCAPSTARAVAIAPPPLHLWELPSETESPAEPAPSAFSSYSTSLLRPQLGQGQTVTAPENNSQRKKKKKITVDEPRNMVFLAWLAALCMPLCPQPDADVPTVVREDVPCRPSWRGFVFFPLPPPLFS